MSHETIKANAIRITSTGTTLRLALRYGVSSPVDAAEVILDIDEIESLTAELFRRLVEMKENQESPSGYTRVTRPM